MSQPMQLGLRIQLIDENETIYEQETLMSYEAAQEALGRIDVHKEKLIAKAEQEAEDEESETKGE